MSFGCQPKVAQVEDRLKKLADLGVVLVAAGGNSGPRPDDTDFPASDIHVISVGALDKKLVVKPDFHQPTVMFMFLENQCVSPQSLISRQLMFAMLMKLHLLLQYSVAFLPCFWRVQIIMFPIPPL